MVNRTKAGRNTGTGKSLGGDPAGRARKANDVQLATRAGRNTPTTAPYSRNEQLTRKVKAIQEKGVERDKRGRPKK
jgi:hypothetical protein